jgi:CDP-glycerol glycerophosphotransferase (TagB/SpsB family)
MIERNSVALCTGMPIDDVKITGYPRNDFLIEKRDSIDSSMLTRFPFLERCVILYAPTFRSNTAVEFFPFDDFRMEELTEFLERQDAHLLLRTHHVDDLLGRNGAVDYHSFSNERITIVNRDTIRDVHDILPYVDILVSDYSGIWVDFLLLNRPVIFVPYDLDTYERNDGLLYDYDYITPGPKVTRFSDMLRELEECCSNPSRDSEKRMRVKHMFHKYEDGMAYKRIHQLVKEQSRRTA